MKKSFSERPLGKFLLGRGFYAALAVCVIGAGAAAWVIVDRTIDSFTAPPAESRADTLQAPSSLSPADKPSSSAVTRPVEQKVSGQPISPSSSSKASVSSKADAPSQAPSAEPAVDAASPVSDVSSYLLPVNGVVFGHFSGDTLVLDETLQKWHTHNGIDIRAEAGTPVLAVANGTVSVVKQDPMWGTVVELTHPNGLLSRYCGLEPDLSVAEGQNVLVGDPLGTLAGSVLAETALESHLHFELFEDGVRVDPLLRLGFLESAD